MAKIAIIVTVSVDIFMGVFSVAKPTATMAHINFKDGLTLSKKMQFTVYGYIHEHQSSSNLKIPQDIILLCLLFYGDTDAWDPKCIPTTMKLDHKTLTQCRNAPANVCCQAIIESGSIEWRFRIEEANPFGMLKIGIWKIRSLQNQPPLTGYIYNMNANGYEYNVVNALRDKYGMEYRSGSIITMTLDMNKLSLKYVLDGMDCGVLWTVEKCKYRAFVSMFCMNDSVTIL